MAPLVGAIAGGNTIIVKPSEIAEYTAIAVKKMLDDTFEEEYIKTILGGIDETTLLLNEHFNKIFFTGSPKVGKIVMEKAAKFLTPVVLELGGKSPCVVDKNVDLDLAVNRIMFGKGINAGQTCVAPDYLLIHEDIKTDFYEKFKQVANIRYGGDHKASEDFGKMINAANYQRVISYLEDGKVVYGGGHSEKDHHIDLTLIEVDSVDKKIMQDEIFGPILPVMTFKSSEEAMEIIDHNPDPLAMYIFSNDNTVINQFIEKVHFGGGCVNDTIMHLTNENLPFGGRGTSGVGTYHGKHSFEAFTHEKAILVSPTFFDMKVKYPPYNKKSTSLLRKWLYK